MTTSRTRRHIYRPHRAADHRRETFCGAQTHLPPVVLNGDGGDFAEPCCGAVVDPRTVCATCTIRAVAWRRAQRRAA